MRRRPAVDGSAPSVTGGHHVRQFDLIRLRTALRALPPRQGYMPATRSEQPFDGDYFVDATFADIDEATQPPEVSKASCNVRMPGRQVYPR